MNSIFSSVEECVIGILYRFPINHERRYILNYRQDRLQAKIDESKNKPLNRLKLLSYIHLLSLKKLLTFISGYDLIIK